MSPFPTPEELAREAREALSRRTETPCESAGSTVWAKSRGGSAAMWPEPDSEPGQAAPAKKKNRRQRT